MWGGASSDGEPVLVALYKVFMVTDIRIIYVLPVNDKGSDYNIVIYLLNEQNKYQLNCFFISTLKVKQFLEGKFNSLAV